MKSLIVDLGWVSGPVTRKSDSSAVTSLAGHTGIGKVRHLDTRYVWLQEVIEQEGGKIRTVMGHIQTRERID